MITIRLADLSEKLEDTKISSSKTVGSTASFKILLDIQAKESLDDVFNQLDTLIAEKKQLVVDDYDLLLKGNVEVAMTYQKGSMWFQQNIDNISQECLDLIFYEVSYGLKFFR